MTKSRTFNELKRFAARIVSIGEKKGFNEEWIKNYIENPIPSTYSHLQVEIVKIYQKVALDEMTHSEAEQSLSFIKMRFQEEKQENEDFNSKILLWGKVVIQIFEESGRSGVIEFTCPFCNGVAKVFSIPKDNNDTVLSSSCTNCDMNTRHRYNGDEK